jgi:predicted  nucleic acid-binding Zn-ribbon protein
MKYLILSCLLAVFGFLQAQEDINVVLKLKTLSQGDIPAFVTFIPQASYSQVQKDWEKYLKDDTKEKTLNQNGEIIILNKVYEKIAPGLLNIYSYIKEYDGEIMLVAALELNGTYISKEMDEEVYIPAKKFVRDFAVESYKMAVAEDFKDAEKELKKLESQKTSLQSSLETVLATISQYERSIVTKKDEISLNQLDQSSKVIQLQAQKELVLKLANAGEVVKEDAKKILKELEKDFKKLQNQNENFYQDIVYYESQMRQNEIDLGKAESEVKFKQLDIDDQAYKLRKIQQKLDNIE